MDQSNTGFNTTEQRSTELKDKSIKYIWLNIEDKKDEKQSKEHDINMEYEESL